MVTVAGAMLMTLYKGHVINLVWSNNIHANTSKVPQANEATDKDWFKGPMLLIGAIFAWASFFIFQENTMRKYTAPLSLTTLVCFMGTLQSIAVTLVMEHKSSAWAIGFDMNLFAAAYAGIVSSSLAYYVQGLVMEKRGPVFVTAFSPLMMTIVAIMGQVSIMQEWRRKSTGWSRQHVFAFASPVLCRDHNIAEAMAALLAIKLCTRRGYQHCVIEMDSKIFVAMLKN
ncbi:WAT1-related protein At5g07050-like [Lycium barbarum]|uniref:WAT1-related protein At5g07050-like n=1 Tax=Lycium barbarum TaxID=112863 RepID=UPI00293F456E|nr:WAT1-related protein At5g07050-like [Lycium barbarum]